MWNFSETKARSLLETGYQNFWLKLDFISRHLVRARRSFQGLIKVWPREEFTFNTYVLVLVVIWAWMWARVRG